METIKSYTDLEQSKKKELSIEQKAQAYDEVVEKLKGFMVQGVDPLITRADVQDFFPELKESEDEKIRKVEQTYAWSKEDEKILNLIIARLHSHPNVEAEEYGKDYHWLKSIKDRVQPQTAWKPSKEQIKVLEFFIPYVTKCNVVLQKSKDTLLSLLSDLKKLKE